MTHAPKPTDLSVKDPDTGSWIYQMGDQDVVDLPFDAGEEIADVSAVLVVYRTLDVQAEPAVSFVGEQVLVNVSGLFRGLFYELSVTFTGMTGQKWTRTLFIECVS
jgi:hypothetical protein